jgi:hypothetical protein
MIISNNDRGDFMQAPSINAISIVNSVANEESALASLIESEANILNSAIKPCTTVNELLCLNKSVIRTMKTVLQKNTVLEVKLRETLNFIREEGVDPSNINELLNNLIFVLDSIGEEEFSLGKLIELIGFEIIKLPKSSTFENIKDVYRNATALMKVIVEKNMVLLKKLRSIVQFIEYILCEGLIFPNCVLENLLNIIKNKLIASIYTEKIGLSKLIQSNSFKLRSAFSNCLTEDELFEIKCITEDVLDTVDEKNKILEYKLEEIIALIKLVRFTSCDLNLIADTFEHIQKSAIQEEKELIKFINSQANKINKNIDSEHCCIDEIIDTNENIANLLLNAAKNLWQNNDQVYNFIKKYN